MQLKIEAVLVMKSAQKNRPLVLFVKNRPLVLLNIVGGVSMMIV